MFVLAVVGVGLEAKSLALGILGYLWRVRATGTLAGEAEDAAGTGQSTIGRYAQPPGDFGYLGLANLSVSTNDC